MNAKYANKSTSRHVLVRRGRTNKNIGVLCVHLLRAILRYAPSGPHLGACKNAYGIFVRTHGFYQRLFSAGIKKPAESGLKSVIIPWEGADYDPFFFM